MAVEKNVVGAAETHNRATYDRIWAGLDDFIRFNPGARHRREMVFSLLDRCRFDTLLDVGCGNAELLQLIAARYPGASLAGIDLSAAVVTANQARMPAARFEVGSVERGDLPSGFDAVVCTEVLEHVDAQAKAMAHLAAAVRPGGHLVLTCPTGPIFSTERHVGHVHHPRAVDVLQWAREAGLTPVSMQQWGFPFYAATKVLANLNGEAVLAAFANGATYGLSKRALSSALYHLNRLNLPSTPWGVQLVALFQRPDERR